ncbi:hypothetical protein FBT96_07365 [Rhodobacter capsulatus]|uniref:Uncharacterized protein n=1 Tax=Rhodobacter capsulatus TaxID=1061 RepID=A0A4U1JSG2_RHOCA|nr:hypothetical protein [Rhodobacter capsulatus]TKD21964.1 hypothetical protein FBT96_07365 [Rhodobacter capsulatus]
MPKDARSFQRESDQFGILLEASSQVYTDFEPANDFTTNFILGKLLELGLELSPKNKHHYKKICATCDFFVAARYARNGLIIWLGGNDEYVGAMYGGVIAREMRERFINAGWMRKVQKSSKKDKLASIYETSIPFETEQLRFKPHGKTQPVIVRSRKKRAPDGKITGGKRISAKKFGDQYEKELDFVREINSAMAANPLTTLDGRAFRHGKRIFNNGSLTQGGRMYGPWQQYREVERLEMTIDEEPVCEIDLKASYLNLANIHYGNGAPLPQDPYQRIWFVEREIDPDRKHSMRALAKKLLSTAVGNESETGALNRTTFPKGREYWDRDAKRMKATPIRKEFNLPKGAKAKDYYADIFRAYPFLTEAEGKWAELMHLESQIILGAVHKLAQEGIATYPVHDSLICKVSDKNRTIEAIHAMMMHYLGATFYVDASILGQDVEIVPPLGNITYQCNRTVSVDWGVDEDISLIEED